MAIVLTEQPTADGLYSAYLPVKFIAEETTNDPAYLEFELKTQAGASIPNVPKYRALNVNNTFTFDASNYLKSVLSVFSNQGYSTTAIEHLDDLYGKYEVEVTDPINGVTALTSNEFYAFTNIDGLRYLNDQTANDGINRKGMLYGSELFNGSFAPKYQGAYDRCVVFAQSPSISIVTYNADKPNQYTTPKQFAEIDISSWTNKLISVPLNRTFLSANALVPPSSTPLSNYAGFKASHAALGDMYYYVEDRCNVQEFIFFNKYGVKENIKFESYDYESVKTSSESYLVGGYIHTGSINYFNTSANNIKVNQSIVEDYEVRGNFFTSKHRGELQDFVASPLQAIVVNGEIRPINVLDGSFKLVEKSRGIDFNFKYRYAQKKPSFK
jgi:hypothetical protein